MKCFSYMQPWASLIYLLEKRVETRSRNYTVLAGRWHAVHASSTWKPDQRKLMSTEPFQARLAYHGITAGNAVHQNFPRGAIIGVAFVSAIGPTEDVVVSDQERAFGDYGPGRWAYHLGQFFGLARPILFTARLGVFDLPAAVERQVMLGLQVNDGLPTDLTSEELLNEAVNVERAARVKRAQAEDTVARALRQLDGGATDTRTPIERMIDQAVGRG